MEAGWPLCSVALADVERAYETLDALPNAWLILRQIGQRHRSVIDHCRQVLVLFLVLLDAPTHLFFARPCLGKHLQHREEPHRLAVVHQRTNSRSVARNDSGSESDVVAVQIAAHGFGRGHNVDCHPDWKLWQLIFRFWKSLFGRRFTTAHSML